MINGQARGFTVAENGTLGKSEGWYRGNWGKVGEVMWSVVRAWRKMDRRLRGISIEVLFFARGTGIGRQAEGNSSEEGAGSVGTSQLPPSITPEA